MYYNCGPGLLFLIWNQSYFKILDIYEKDRSNNEVLESVMCEVVRIRLKRRIATRSGKGNQPLVIKTAVEPILKLGLL